MGNKVNVYASEVAKFLEAKLLGPDILLNGASSLSGVNANKIAFVKNETLQENIDISALYLVNNLKKIEKNSRASYIIIDNPRLAFAKVMDKFFVFKRAPKIHPTAIISSNVVLGEGVSIGAYTVIGENVSIGNNTVINHHVTVSDGVIIGESCYIKSTAVIGEDGFGFDFTQEKVPVRIPHLGSVSIGSFVEIGSFTTVVRGTLDNTIIKDNVKIDDHVHIAHNCIIEKNTIITACAEISGSVKIGENCWIAPNASIINGVAVGNNTLVGIGSVVTKSILSDVTVMGLNAIEIEKLRKYKEVTQYGR